jgi:ribonuclease HII
VVAAVVILPPSRHIVYRLAPIRDSKLLTPRARDACYELVTRYALDYASGFVSAREIDRLGIVPATRKAMRLALSNLRITPDGMLIDHVELPDVPLPQESMPHGDRLCLSIAAASIIAKVTRDRWMIDLDQRLPGYGFAQNKGYGTSLHCDAIYLHGTTDEHRHSFEPVRLCDEAWHGR